MLEKEIEEIKEEETQEDPEEEETQEDPKKEEIKEEDSESESSTGSEKVESVPERLTYESTVEITQSNQSTYADFDYPSYTQLYWGSLVNGLIVGVMIALISSVIRNCFKVVTLNINKED